ncbi:MAG: hypothetical protein HYV07_33845 [Deltaproteobacteria bacterium]|nr:hypothetical protein [Deltaproteobacteria bacterium]
MPSPRSEWSRLSDALLDTGVVDRSQLARAMAQQQKSGRRLLRVLVESGFVDEDRLVRTLSVALRLESVTPATMRINSRVLSLLPADVALKRGALPIAIKRTNQVDYLYVAMADPLDAEALADLRRASGCEITVLVAPPIQLDEALDRHYRGPDASVPEGPAPKGLEAPRLQAPAAPRRPAYSLPGEVETLVELEPRRAAEAQRRPPEPRGRGSVPPQPSAPPARTPAPAQPRSRTASKSRPTPPPLPARPASGPSSGSSLLEETHDGSVAPVAYIAPMTDDDDDEVRPQSDARRIDGFVVAPSRSDSGARRREEPAPPPLPKRTSLSTPQIPVPASEPLVTSESATIDVSIDEVVPKEELAALLGGYAAPPEEDSEVERGPVTEVRALPIELISEPPPEFAPTERPSPHKPSSRPPFPARRDLPRGAHAALEVPFDLESTRSPFDDLRGVRLRAGLERTGIIPAIDWSAQEFEPPPVGTEVPSTSARHFVGVGDIPTAAIASIEGLEAIEELEDAPKVYKGLRADGSAADLSGTRPEPEPAPAPPKEARPPDAKLKPPTSPPKAVRAWQEAVTEADFDAEARIADALRMAEAAKQEIARIDAGKAEAARAEAARAEAAKAEAARAEAVKAEAARAEAAKAEAARAEAAKAEAKIEAMRAELARADTARAEAAKAEAAREVARAEAVRLEAARADAAKVEAARELAKADPKPEVTKADPGRTRRRDDKRASWTPEPDLSRSPLTPDELEKLRAEVGRRRKDSATNLPDEQLFAQPEGDDEPLDEGPTIPRVPVARNERAPGSDKPLRAKALPAPSVRVPMEERPKPPLPKAEAADPVDPAARALVQALAAGESLTSSDRAQVTLAVVRLLLKRGIISEGELASELVAPPNHER